MQPSLWSVLEHLHSPEEKPAPISSHSISSVPWDRWASYLPLSVPLGWIIAVTTAFSISFFFFVLTAPCGIWDLSSPTRGQTRAPFRGRARSLTIGPPGKSRRCHSRCLALWLWTKWLVSKLIHLTGKSECLGSRNVQLLGFSVSYSYFKRSFYTSVLVWGQERFKRGVVSRTSTLLNWEATLVPY